MHVGVLALLVLPSYQQYLGYGGVPIAGHALWAEVGGSTIHETLGEFTGVHKRDAVYASVRGTAQSPWLWCMYGILG